MLPRGILGSVVPGALRAFWEMWSPEHTELAPWHMLLLSLPLDNIASYSERDTSAKCYRAYLRAEPENPVLLSILLYTIGSASRHRVPSSQLEIMALADLTVPFLLYLSNLVTQEPSRCVC